MNVIDTLIIENLALFYLMTDKYYFEDSNSSLALFYAVVLSIFGFLPLLGLIVFIAYRILKRIRSELYPSRTKQLAVNSNQPTADIPQQDQYAFNDGDQQLPDRMLHPREYKNNNNTTIEMNPFENVSYVRASY
jgi:hypothetical protein